MITVHLEFLLSHLTYNRSIVVRRIHIRTTHNYLPYVNWIKKKRRKKRRNYWRVVGRRWKLAAVPVYIYNTFGSYLNPLYRLFSQLYAVCSMQLSFNLISKLNGVMYFVPCVFGVLCVYPVCIPSILGFSKKNIHSKSLSSNCLTMLLQWIPTNQQNHVPPANYLFSIWIYSSCIHSNFSFLCYSYRLGDLRVACGWSLRLCTHRHTQLHSERLQNKKKKKMKIHRIIWLGHIILWH